MGFYTTSKHPRNKRVVVIFTNMIGLVIAMVILAFVDVGIEYYLYDGLRVNEMIVVLLGLLYLLS